MRTVYLGTSGFAAAVLRRLADSPHRPLLTVTPPDRRQGRGRKVSSPPAALAATELGIELAQAESVNEGPVLERIRALRPEALIVCAFGQMIREPLLSEFPILNVHPSLLPRWRGAAPIERAIMAGDEVTGVCIMRLTEGLDSGPVALAEEIPIGPEVDFGGLSAELEELGAKLLIAALDRQEAGELRFSEQDEDAVTYAEKIAAADRRLDPAGAASDLARRVRALSPHIGAYVELGDGKRLGVRAARPTEAGPPVGELRLRDRVLLLGCGEGALALETVLPEGGRAMAAADYARGHGVATL